MSGQGSDFEPGEREFLSQLAGAGAACPSPARLQAFAVGALPEEQAEPLERHLSGCAVCRMLARDLAEWQPPPVERSEVDRLWRRVADGSPQLRRKRWRPHWAWLSLPAAAAAALVLVLRLAPEVPPPVPRPPAIASIAVPRYDLRTMAAVEKAPIRLPASALLLWRGTNPAAPPAETRELVAALTPYGKDDFRQAAILLAPVSQRHPRSFEAAFYQGVSLLLLERPAEAAAPLERARALGDGPQKNEASWYLALARLRTGSIRQARPLLEEACTGGGAHAGSACGALRQLAAPVFVPPPG
jgi:hypothetical protein